MRKPILIYAIALSAGAFLLQWIEFRYAVRRLSSEVYVLILAIGFTALGIWVGNRLTQQRAAAEPTINRRALESLGISDREHAVLELLVAGHSNREIAERLFVSANTIKSHVARLYQKLEVSRRTQAVKRARDLKLVV